MRATCTTCMSEHPGTQDVWQAVAMDATSRARSPIKQDIPEVQEWLPCFKHLYLRNGMVAF